MATLEIIGEIGAFVVLLITIFTLYGKVIKDYTKLKTDVTQLQKDYSDLVVEMKADYESLRLEIARLNNERNKEYRIIVKQISDNHTDMLNKNEKLFKEMLGLIRDHEKQNNDSIAKVYEKIDSKI